MRSIRTKALALALVAVGLFVDLWTKDLAQRRLDMDASDPLRSSHVEVIPGFLRLQGNWNEGITFGMLPGRTEPILAFTAVACLVILLVLVLTRSPSRVLHVALALILAGAVGNLHDRWHWHRVRDFVVVYWKDPSIWQWPAFNAADAFIVVGVGLVLARELFGRRRPEGAPAGAGGP